MKRWSRPDGKRAVFIRNWNLWVRDIATAEEKQLTTDGVTNYGYATDNAGWTHSNRAVAVWSPDSKSVRDVSAGPAQDRHDVPRQHQRGSSFAGRVALPRCPATKT